MQLQSNIFNITKMRDGIDATNSMRINTNVETIYKFPDDYDEEKSTDLSDPKGIIYILSPGILKISVASFKEDSGLIVTDYLTNNLFTPSIKLNDRSLKEIIQTSKLVNYLYAEGNGGDPHNWDFNIKALYEDYLTKDIIIETKVINGLVVATGNRDYLLSYFLAIDPTNIEIEVISAGTVLYKFLPLLIGSNLDIATLSIKAAEGIFAAMLGAGLAFTADGLEILNGNLSVTNSNGDPVFTMDKNTGGLSITGEINATSGYFAGDISAATGTFTGSINATTGEIGGFKVGEYSIESTTGDLLLYSQTNLSLDAGEIEQGSIYSNGGENFDSDYRVRTRNYIPVLPGHTYIIKTNILYIVIKEYGSQGAKDFLRTTPANFALVGESGYSYTASSDTNYIRIVLAKNTSTSGTKIVPDDVEKLTIEGNESLINVRNIHIGDGGFIDGSLKVGNLSILNPNKSSEDNTVLMLKVPGEDPYFRLTNEGYIEGPNWSIKKESGNDYVTARFGKLIAEDGEFNGIIRARDGVFTGEVLSSVITASTINTANFVTENTRSMGGSFIFKPTFEIRDITNIGTSTRVLFELDETAADYFSLTDKILFNSETFELGTISTTGNLYDNTARIRTKDYITVNSNEKFKITGVLVGGSSATISEFYIRYYTNGKLLTGNATVAVNGSFTIPADVYYMKIVVANTVTDGEISPEDLSYCEIERISDKIVAISGVDIRFGKIYSVADNKIQVTFKDADYNLLNTLYKSSDFESGTLDRGLPADREARIRTKDFILVNPGDKISEKVKKSSSSTATISWTEYVYYDNDKNYVGFEDNNIATIPDNVGYIKIIMANTISDGTLEPSDIDTYYLMNSTELMKNYSTLTLFGSAYHDTLIGINSDDISVGDILPPHALTMETFTGLLETTESHTGDIDYNLNLLLGDLSTLKLKLNSSFNYIDGYGLYADNVFLHGSLMTEDSAGSYAGIHTSKDLDFSYSNWGGTRTDTYTNEKIIFWGGANSLADSDILRSPFIVTDKGSIFASRGEFKGAVIADSIITDAIIKTPVIYGSDKSSGSPSLKIYDTNSSSTIGGIGFYKLVGAIDKESSETNDVLTLNLSNTGFTHYNGFTGTLFIRFSEGSNNIYYTGTNLVTGTTTFSSRSIKDLTGSSTPAEISVQGYSGGVKGEIQLICDVNISNPEEQHGIQISSEGIWNFGGKVLNDGETVFLGSGNQLLDYKVNSNGYYCLYVS